jgi:hypothetical protein
MLSSFLKFEVCRSRLTLCSLTVAFDLVSLSFAQENYHLVFVELMFVGHQMCEFLVVVFIVFNSQGPMLWVILFSFVVQMLLVILHNVHFPSVVWFVEHWITFQARCLLLLNTH